MSDRRPSRTRQKISLKRNPGPPKSRNRPYDNRPHSGPGLAFRTSPGEKTIEVVLPDEPPRLTPGAARALLRVLLKAQEGVTACDSPGGDDAE
jgi:hypothetical protein